MSAYSPWDCRGNPPWPPQAIKTLEKEVLANAIDLLAKHGKTLPEGVDEQIKLIIKEDILAVHFVLMDLTIELEQRLGGLATIR